MCVYLCQTQFYPCPHFTSKSNKNHVAFSPFSNPTSKRNLKKITREESEFSIIGGGGLSQNFIAGVFCLTRAFPVTSVGWLWYFIDQKSGPVNWKGNRHSLSWYTWLPLSGPFCKTLYFLVLNPFWGVSAIRNCVWDVDKLEFSGHLNGKNGTVQLRLGLSWTDMAIHSACLRKCGGETEKLGPFNKVSTVTGFVQHKSDDNETKGKGRRVGIQRKEREVVGMSHLSHFGLVLCTGLRE